MFREKAVGSANFGLHEAKLLMRVTTALKSQLTLISYYLIISLLLFLSWAPKTKQTSKARLTLIFFQSIL